MGIVDALFEVTDERLKALYHRAWLEENRGLVDTRKHPDGIRRYICMPESITAVMMRP